MKYAHYNSFNIKYIYVNLSCKYLINSRVTLLTSTSEYVASHLEFHHSQADMEPAKTSSFGYSSTSHQSMHH